MEAFIIDYILIYGNKPNKKQLAKFILFGGVK